MKAGRPRKAIKDIERLYDKDPDMVLQWLRKTGQVSFELCISSYIGKWINEMDQKRYQRVKGIVDQGVKDHLGPKIPDNVIPLDQRRRAGSGNH